MPLIDGKSVLEALHDIDFLERRPASLMDILKYMCFTHRDVSTNLLTALQLTLDAGVRFGYLDQIDENYYVPSNTRENVCSRSEDNEAMDSKYLYCQSSLGNPENDFNADIEKTIEDIKPKSNSNPTSPTPSTSVLPSSSPKSHSQENEFKGRKQTGRRKSSNVSKPKRRIIADRNRKRKIRRRRQ
ncbi:uncharacterized protein LOC119642746 [Glossina fuscipes]|uniref:Uncharacterized protein LOC119642746 n=1 Tax=Glossina fuscipes TaxID=7396 RepID=A0A9C5ZFU5_9MUSC|nr:uncharacterized protein LOC119642746 [Glossina fuscipes]